MCKLGTYEQVYNVKDLKFMKRMCKNESDLGSRVQTTMTKTMESGVDNVAFEDDDKGYQKSNNKDDGHCEKSSNGHQLSEEAQNIDDKILSRRIMKNIITISIAFTFLFTAYNSMANLQASINQTDGTASLTTVYAFLVLSCCLLPSLIIKTIKTKYTMAICMLGYSLYIAAQFQPSLASLIPTAALVGLCAAPLWSAKCSYLTMVGTKYAELTGTDKEVIITRYFGIFFLFFQSTQVWGNLISSLVLSVGINGVDPDRICGYDFCLQDAPVINGTNDTTDDSDSIPPWQRYTMSGIYLGFALLSSVVIIIFVDPLRSLVGKEKETQAIGDKSATQLLVGTFNHMRHPYQLLIIPLTIWSGVEQGFFQSDYTAAYVSCSIGVDMVGYVMICYGVCDAVCSISFSPLVKFIGRIPVFIFGAIINFGVTITLIYWNPDPDNKAIFFVLAGLWGVSDAVWQTQINAFYGVLFPGKSEVAFSNYRLWESLGFIISFATSTALCTYSKITIVLVFLSVGILGYVCIEIIEKLGGLKKDSKGEVITIEKLITRNY